MTDQQDDKDRCYICNVELDEGNQGDDLDPFQLHDYPDGEVLHVCTTCEATTAHSNRVMQSYVNHQAEASHQEWCAETYPEEDEES